MSTEPVELEARLIEMVVGKRDEIIQSAEKKSKQTLDQAREKAKEILAEGREKRFKASGIDLRSISDRIVRKAEQEGRKRMMETREEVISSVFNNAETILKGIAEGRDKSADYHDILSKLVLEAVLTIRENDVVVAVNSRDKEYMTKGLRRIETEMKKTLGQKAKLTLMEDPIDCLGGATAFDYQKRKIFYNTLEGRLKKARGSMRAEVAKLLEVI